jgi:hypothetical protein
MIGAAADAFGFDQVAEDAGGLERGDVAGEGPVPDRVPVVCFVLGEEGHDEIRAVYAGLLADRPAFSSAGQQPVVRHGDLALTSTRLPGGGATVEVARRQPDGSWRWVIDYPALLS